MFEEQLISFETAKLAREKGFNIETFTAYIGNTFFKSEPEPNGYDGWELAESNNWNRKNWVFTKSGSSCFGCKLDNVKYFEACSAPTQSLLQKWLREVHNIHISINITNIGRYYAQVFKFQPENRSNMLFFESQNSFDKVDTHEKALEQGLQEALKLK